MFGRFYLTCCLLFSVACGPLAVAQGNDFFLYFGTYTGFKFVSQSLTHGVGNSRSEGIYVSRFNAATGELSEPELAAKIVNPAFLAISPNHSFLYAITEDPLSVGPPFDHSSYATAFAIDSASGKLRFINSLPTGGTSTCFLSMDKTGKFVFFAQFRKRQCVGVASKRRWLARRADCFYAARRSRRIKSASANQSSSPFRDGLA